MPSSPFWHSRRLHLSDNCYAVCQFRVTALFYTFEQSRRLANACFTPFDNCSSDLLFPVNGSPVTASNIISNQHRTAVCRFWDTALLRAVWSTVLFDTVRQPPVLYLLAAVLLSRTSRFSQIAYKGSSHQTHIKASTDIRLFPIQLHKCTFMQLLFFQSPH